MVVRLVRRSFARLVRKLRRTPPKPLAATLNLDEPHVALNPFPYYEMLRAAGPVHFLERHGAWIVIGHDEVQWAFQHPEALSNSPYAEVDSVLLAADPPDHTRMRKLVTAYFDRDRIDELARYASERSRALLRPHMDVVRDYGEGVSEAVASRLTGFSDDACEEIRATARNSRDFGRILETLRNLAPATPMYARMRSDGMTDIEARSLVALFWVASTKTTERVIAQCVLELLRNSDARGRVSADPSLLSRFVDEVMRLHQPEPMLRRASLVPLTLGGRHIPAGAVVYLSLAAANRDPSHYPDPAAVRLDRAGTRHLTFGHGIHYCIGATLGRATVMAALRALLEDAPAFTSVHPLDEVPIVATMMARHIDRLIIETGK